SINLGGPVKRKIGREEKDLVLFADPCRLIFQIRRWSTCRSDKVYFF
ncbi:unnamed protein product, partial [Musa acuminata subsp. burmannicoides]